MAVGDITRVRYTMAFGFQIGLVIRHYRHSAVAGAGINHQQIADTLNTLHRPSFLALITTQATFHFVGAQKIEPLPASLEFKSTQPPEAGLAGATPLPPQVSGLLSLRTNNAGRRNRGRAYIPFPSEERNDNGLPTATYVTALQDLGNLLDNTQVLTIGVDSETLIPVIFRRGFSPRTIDLQTTLARTAWATQRRRGALAQPNIIL